MESSIIPVPQRRAQALVVIGMAGSGKTTFVNKYYEELTKKGKTVYTVNLDPAVQRVPYPINIDIRDTVNYKDVMKKYNLGPNGAIMTALNLFSTRFDQVLKLMEARVNEVDYFLIDTPGQIEVFNWSASGTIILQCLSGSFPTYIMYVTDSKRCEVPTSFTSTMLYCCSVLYKSNLPLVCVFNKSDISDTTKLFAWMKDYDSFFDESKKADIDESYMASLSRSTALSMMQFYEEIESVAVSSVNGRGMNELLLKMPELRMEFEEIFKIRMENQKKLHEKMEQEGVNPEKVVDC